jgi:hypothetical protein
VRKPSLKRRLAENDDEDDTPAPKRAAKAARARRPRAVSDDISSPDDGLSELAKSRPLSPVEDMDVDIEGGGSPATAASSQPRSQSTSALKKSVDAISSRPKRRTLKRAVVSSDSDSVNEYNDPQGAAMEREEDSDDEPPPPTKDRGKERDRPTPASSVIRNGKGILSTKIPKKKPTMDDKPITIKDESKKVTSSSATPMLATTGLNETSKGNDTPKDLAKRKLGAIPKKKTALGSTPPIASSASTNKTAPADPLDLLQNPTKLAAKRRDMDKPAEINLFNTSTLQDLFKVCSFSFFHNHLLMNISTVFKHGSYIKQRPYRGTAQGPR